MSAGDALVGVDLDGTLTDLVVVSDGKSHPVKVATEYGRTESAVLGAAAEAGVADASVFNHASTHGLNAVITRSGAPPTGSCC